MNAFKLFTLCSLLCISQSFGQHKGMAIYKKRSKININLGNSTDTAPSSLNPKNINERINNMQFILRFKDTLALYEKEKLLESTTDDRLAQVFSGYSGPYYFNFKSGEVLRVKGKYLITKHKKEFEWTLHPENILINGITCYKATTELTLQGRRGTIIRPVTAWYAPEITIFAGPDGFTGLPGLIIQTEVKDVVTTLEKIEFNTKIDPIHIPTTKKHMTEKEFEDHLEDIIKQQRQIL